ncbi:MAG: YfcE family phosphodiesterase [Megasphaera cerevisiae]|jgi:putative phosphoesterase|nr:YfcE family phosphodiesterase [Megasphaera cerevisiae]
MKPVLIGVVSDSHGRFRELERMVEQAPDVSVWLHGGDYCNDGEDLSIYTGVPVYSVRGNNDFMSNFAAPECRKIRIDGMNVMLIHGHQWYGQQRLEKLVELGQTHAASLVAFGHTHRRFLKKTDGITILNPGSIGLPRDGHNGTYAVCTISKGILTNVRIYELTR